MTITQLRADNEAAVRAAIAEYIQDRWADAGTVRRKGLTNERRVVNVVHQIRHAERNLSWTERCNREIARWRAQ